MRVPGIPNEARPPQLMNATAAYVRDFVLPAALSLLPKRMNTAPARAMLMAIGLQESRFQYRRQLGGGPARSFWEFEMGGINGVLQHPSTRLIITSVLGSMRYLPRDCYVAIEHNDTLAAVFARLLLYTHPKPLPTDADDAWVYYLATWRPGKPHRDTWDEFYRHAAAMEGV